MAERKTQTTGIMQQSHSQNLNPSPQNLETYPRQPYHLRFALDFAAHILDFAAHIPDFALTNPETLRPI